MMAQGQAKAKLGKVNAKIERLKEFCREAQADTDTDDDLKLYPIEVEIYHGGDTLTEDELEESYMSVYGNTGGDNDTVDNLVDEMTTRGCWVEYPEDDKDAVE